MTQTLTLETTVIQRETRRIADMLFVPTESLVLAGVRTPMTWLRFLGCGPACP
jgi:hypothetical protein